MENTLNTQEEYQLQDYQLPSEGLIPRKALTVLMGKLAASHAGGLTTAVIKWFIKRYQVNMEEALNPDPASYACFNDFFTRELKADARPIDTDENHIISPVDAVLSQFGPIDNETMIQAKGHHYSLTDLLAGEEDKVSLFKNGTFACYYLSPKDYHRIHMPADAKLTSMTYVPGTLYSVSLKTAASIPNLFAKNERLVCYFQTAKGPMAMILVGATVVGSIETVWAGTVCPPHGKKVIQTNYHQKDIHLNKGAEMGRFKLGSTVIMLHGKDLMAYEKHLHEGIPTRLGQHHGTWL